MCKPNTPDTSYQQAEAAREQAAQDQLAQQQLAQQQQQWETERADSEARYQQQLDAQNAEIARQAQLQKDTEAQSEQLRQQQIDQQNAVNARARSYTDARDQAIAQGQQQINQAYGGYDDAYFQNFANQFLAANSGDTQRQFDDTQRSMKYKLADARNLNSSAAADAFGEISTDRNSAITKIAAAGSDAANNLRTQLNTQKQDALNTLYGLGNTAPPDFQTDADASAATSKIGDAIKSMTAGYTSNAAVQNSYSPLALGATG
jgi:hypothetical protein